MADEKMHTHAEVKAALEEAGGIKFDTPERERMLDLAVGDGPVSESRLAVMINAARGPFAGQPLPES